MIKTTAGSRSKPPRPQKSPPMPEKSIPAPSIQLNLQLRSLSNSSIPPPIFSPSKSAVNDRDEPTAAVSSLNDWKSDLQNEPVRVPVPFGTELQPQNSLISTQKERMADSPRKSEPDELCITPEMERICVQSFFINVIKLDNSFRVIDKDMGYNCRFTHSW